MSEDYYSNENIDEDPDEEIEKYAYQELDEKVENFKYKETDKELVDDEQEEQREGHCEEVDPINDEDKGKDEEKLQEKYPIEEAPMEEIKVKDYDIRHTRKIDVMYLLGVR